MNNIRDLGIFSKPNLSSGWTCPICKTAEEKEVVLIGVQGTQEDNIIQAEQIHIKCLLDNLRYQKKYGVIACYADSEERDKMIEKTKKTIEKLKGIKKSTTHD